MVSVAVTLKTPGPPGLIKSRIVPLASSNNGNGSVVEVLPVYATARCVNERPPSIDWATLADAMTERVATHGVRRAAEMREAAYMLREAGFNEALASAVAEAQARGAKGRNIAGA